MITPKLVNDDIVIEGEMQVDDRVPNLCCQGFDWVVATTIIDVWGVCQNPDCHDYQKNMKPEDDPYRGVSHWDVRDLAEWMLDHPVTA